jgi:hypothetical protein
MRNRDRQRRLDAESQRHVREQLLEGRKRAAFRVLDGGGTTKDAAAVAKCDSHAVLRWVAARVKA